MSPGTLRIPGSIASTTEPGRPAVAHVDFKVDLVVVVVVVVVVDGDGDGDGDGDVDLAARTLTPIPNRVAREERQRGTGYLHVAVADNVHDQVHV